MKLIFCSSFLEVPVVMSFVENIREDYVIVTAHDGLVKLFSQIYEKDKIKVFRRLNILSKSPLKIVQNCFAIRNYQNQLKKEFKDFQKCQVYFFTRTYVEFEMWIIKELSKKNDIFFMDKVKVDVFPLDRSLKAIIGVFFRKVLFNIDFMAYKFGPSYSAFVADDNFLRAVNAQAFKVVENQDVVAGKMEPLLKEIKSVKCMLLTGSDVDFLYGESEYIAVVDKVINHLINEYGEDFIAVKGHPDGPKYYSLERSIKKIPYYLPANIIVINCCKVVIGYVSVTIAEAAQAGKCAISLLFLIPCYDNTIRDSFVTYLASLTSNKIYYPSTVDELSQIIKNNV